MGLFRENLNWRTLATWPIGAVSLPLAMAGLLARYRGQHAVAALAFAVAAVVMTMRVIHTAVISPHSKSNKITFIGVFGLIVVGVTGYLVAVTQPGANEGALVGQQTAHSLTGRDIPLLKDGVQNPSSFEKPPASLPRPDQATRSENGARRSAPKPSPSARTPSSPQLPLQPPMKAPETAPENVCSPSIPDREPRVRLSPGDVVVAGGGVVSRLDSLYRESRIALGDYVERVRGIAVGNDAQIYLASIACRQGAVVRLDPMTGIQTVLATGFRTTVAIGLDRDGSVLVSDENPAERRWGQLFRFNFERSESSVEHSFTIDSVPTTIAFDPRNGQMVVAAKRIYRMTESGPRPLGLNVSNVHALAFAPSGDAYVAEYDGGPVVQVDLAEGSVVKTFEGFPTIWSMAITRDGRDALVGSGSGGNAILHRVSLEGGPSAAVWKASSGAGVGTFVTVVGPLLSR